MTGHYTIGAVLRPGFRRMCFNLGLTYREDKGWLDSAFFVTGPAQAIARLNARLQEILDEEADEKAAEILAEAEKRMRRHNRPWRRFGRWIRSAFA